MGEQPPNQPPSKETTPPKKETTRDLLKAALRQLVAEETAEKHSMGQQLIKEPDDKVFDKEIAIYESVVSAMGKDGKKRADFVRAVRRMRNLNLPPPSPPLKNTRAEKNEEQIPQKKPSRTEQKIPLKESPRAHREREEEGFNAETVVLLEDEGFITTKRSYEETFGEKKYVITEIIYAPYIKNDNASHYLGVTNWESGLRRARERLHKSARGEGINIKFGSVTLDYPTQEQAAFLLSDAADPRIKETLAELAEGKTPNLYIMPDPQKSLSDLEQFFVWSVKEKDDTFSVRTKTIDRRMARSDLKIINFPILTVKTQKELPS